MVGQQARFLASSFQKAMLNLELLNHSETERVLAALTALTGSITALSQVIADGNAKIEAQNTEIIRLLEVISRSTPAQLS